MRVGWWMGLLLVTACSSPPAPETPTSPTTTLGGGVDRIETCDAALPTMAAAAGGPRLVGLAVGADDAWSRQLAGRAVHRVTLWPDARSAYALSRQGRWEAVLPSSAETDVAMMAAPGDEYGFIRGGYRFTWFITPKAEVHRIDFRVDRAAFAPRKKRVAVLAQGELKLLDSARGKALASRTISKVDYHAGEEVSWGDGVIVLKRPRPSLLGPAGYSTFDAHTLVPRVAGATGIGPGGRLLVKEDPGRVRILDGRTGATRAIFATEQKAVRTELSHDGRFVYRLRPPVSDDSYSAGFSDADHELVIHDAKQKRTQTAPFKLQHQALHLSKKGDLLCVPHATDDRVERVFDPAQHRVRTDMQCRVLAGRAHFLKLPSLAQYAPPLSPVLFTEDGTRAGYLSRRKTGTTREPRALVIDPATGKVLTEFEAEDIQPFGRGGFAVQTRSGSFHTWGASPNLAPSPSSRPPEVPSARLTRQRGRILDVNEYGFVSRHGRAVHYRRWEGGATRELEPKCEPVLAAGGPGYLSVCREPNDKTILRWRAERERTDYTWRETKPLSGMPAAHTKGQVGVPFDDGRIVVYRGSEKRVYRPKPHGEKNDDDVRYCRAQGRQCLGFNELAWSPRGRYLAAFQKSTRTLVVIDTEEREIVISESAERTLGTRLVFQAETTVGVHPGPRWRLDTGKRWRSIERSDPEPDQLLKVAGAQFFGGPTTELLRLESMGSSFEQLGYLSGPGLLVGTKGAAARLYDATSGATVATVVSEPGGQIFSFLADGRVDITGPAVDKLVCLDGASVVSSSSCRPQLAPDALAKLLSLRRRALACGNTSSKGQKTRP
ncbi:MAG: hypothetical protein AAGA56_07495 [Myxococcota bacterium]